MWQWTSDVPEWRDMSQQHPLPVPCGLYWCVVREFEVWNGSGRLRSKIWARGSIRRTTSATSITTDCWIRIKGAFHILGYAALEALTSDCHWKGKKKLQEPQAFANEPFKKNKNKGGNCKISTFIDSKGLTELSHIYPLWTPQRVKTVIFWLELKRAAANTVSTNHNASCKNLPRIKRKALKPISLMEVQTRNHKLLQSWCVTVPLPSVWTNQIDAFFAVSALWV